MNKPEKSLYDTDDYYSGDAKATRIAFAHNLLLYLDKLKAQQVASFTGLKEGRALDVGAGDGKYLYFLKKLGFEVHGTTASQNAQAAAKKCYDVDLLYTTDLPDSLRAVPFDVVTYWHVFEHLEHEEEHTRLWHSLVRTGGHLILEVPNISSAGARLCYKSWLGSDDKHHINHRPPEYLRALLERCGFRIVKETGFSLKFTYVFLWSALLGFLFSRWYDFDEIMALLQSPFRYVSKKPIRALNAVLALVYLMPFIFLIAAFETIKGNGEVTRIFAKKVKEVSV